LAGGSDISNIGLRIATYSYLFLRVCDCLLCIICSLGAASTSPFNWTLSMNELKTTLKGDDDKKVNGKLTKNKIN
jgi:hypothetical protein